MGFFQWSKNPASNGGIDSAINFREGQAPSTFNDSARGMMAVLAKWRDDTNGTLETGGSGTAYTLTTNTNISLQASVPDGFEVACEIHAASGVAPTLVVDGQNPSPITYKPGFAPDAGMIEAGSIQRFRYHADDEEWRMHGVVARAIEEPGVEKTYYGSDLPAGYVWANGMSIGNALSGATGRAHADCERLFAKLHSAIANSELPIQDSSGTATTRATGGTAAENAAADFAANKRLPTPDRRDRGTIGRATMGGGSDAALIADDDTTLLGKKLGAEKVTLVAGNIPQMTTSTDGAHTHSFQDGSYLSSRGTGGSQSDVQPSAGITGSSGVHSHTVGEASPAGVNKMPPAIVCNVIIKL